MNLKTKEKAVILSLRSGDELTSCAFRQMLERFSDEDAMNTTCHTRLIRAVYFPVQKSLLWKIASENNICERSLYHYRSCYLAWINFYMKKLSEKT